MRYEIGYAGGGSDREVRMWRRTLNFVHLYLWWYDLHQLQEKCHYAFSNGQGEGSLLIDLRRQGPRCRYSRFSQRYVATCSTQVQCERVDLKGRWLLNTPRPLLQLSRPEKDYVWPRYGHSRNKQLKIRARKISDRRSLQGPGGPSWRNWQVYRASQGVAQAQDYDRTIRRSNTWRNQKHRSTLGYNSAWVEKASGRAWWEGPPRRHKTRR